MKTADLIARLQEADPSGDLEVCIGNLDIHYVAAGPAYYDGCLQVLKRDASKRPFFDIVGAEFRSDGHKVVIHDYSVEDLLMDFPDAPVSYDSGYARKHYSEKVEQWRTDGRGA